MMEPSALTDTQTDPIPYRVLSRSMEHGVTAYGYDSRNDALEGLTTIVLADLLMRDNILRWYRIEPIEEEEDGDS